MSFLYPSWFAALIIIPLVIIVVIITRNNRAKVWAKFVSTHHKEKLVKQNNPIRFWIALTLSLLGIICLITAAARPYQGKSVTRNKIQSRNILIAMDTSLSMLCEDVQPSRLSSGVTFAVNLIKALPDDHIGVMAFAGSPNVITSLSIDHPSIIEELAYLGPSSAHTAGSNLPDALYEGIYTLKRAGKQANALILITDGSETLEEIQEITTLAKESFVQIFTVGTGTAAGGPIPINGQLHRDRQSRVVHTKLNDKILRQLARDTNGAYTNINTQPEIAIANAIQSMNKFEQQGREVQIPNERYQWFLASGILLLITSSLINARFKSSIPALILIISLATPSETKATESWVDAITTEYINRPAAVQAGYRALNKENYPSAIKHLTNARVGTKGETHAKLSLAIAQAAYRNKNYTLASQEFSQALTSKEPQTQNKSQYNLANTLFKQHTSDFNVPENTTLQTYLEQQIRSKKLPQSKLNNIEQGLKSAITHYTDLIEVNKQHTPAKSNREAAQKVIEAIKKARKTIAEEEKKKKDQEKKDQEKKDQEKKDQEKKDQEKKDQEKKDQEKKDQEKKDQEKKKPNDAEGDKPNNKNDPKNPNKKENSKGKEKGKPNNKKDKTSDPKTKPENNQQNKNKQDNKNQGEQKNPNNKANPTPKNNKPIKLTDQQKALNTLKKHADSAKKPTRNRNNYFNRPAIDW